MSGAAVETETDRNRLVRTMKSTAGSRFIAAARLERHDKQLTRLTAFTSAYVIALTVLPYFLKQTATVTDLYNFVTVVLSVVILVSSLLQYSNGDVVNAEQHHRSGLEINELRRLLLLKDPQKITPAQLEEFTEKYGAILQKYSINHEDIDYLQYQLERPEDHDWMGFGDRLTIRLRLAYRKYLPSLILVAITISVGFLIWRGVSPHLT
jgi:hypothetical protein